MYVLFWTQNRANKSNGALMGKAPSWMPVVWRRRRLRKVSFPKVRCWSMTRMSAPVNAARLLFERGRGRMADDQKRRSKMIHFANKKKNVKKMTQSLKKI